MSEEPLQGMEIDPGLEQVSGKTVAQHMDPAGLIDSGATLGLSEGLLDPGGAHGTPSVSTGKEKQLTWPYTSPVVAQCFEELR